MTEPQSTEPTLHHPTFDGHAIRGYHLFAIPPVEVDTLFHVFHSIDEYDRDRVSGILNQFNGKTDVVDKWQQARIEAKHEGQEAVVWFTPDPDLPKNERAQAIVSEVFGWHMIFNGVVLIDGLREDAVAEVIKNHG